MADFTEVEKKKIKNATMLSDLDQDLIDKLYTHFTSNGEMPYGVAKARTGDPDQWIEEHMLEVI